MSKVSWFLEGTSHYATMFIGKKWGNKFPMHFVCSFPRSGSTWLSELMADYLNLPRPRHYIFPIGFSSVIHTHVSPKFGLKNCLYIYRDGRDCYTSFYHYLIKKLEEDGASFNEYNFWVKKFSQGNYQDSVEKNFCIFLEVLFQKKWNWNNHVSGWLENSSKENKVVPIQFEKLKKQTLEVLSEACMKKYGKVSEETLREAIDRQSLQKQKTRSTDQHRTFIRKGISGDWKTLFNTESAQIFDYYAGKTLIQLGYEKDHNWVSNINTKSQNNEYSSLIGI